MLMFCREGKESVHHPTLMIDDRQTFHIHYGHSNLNGGRL